MYFKKKRFTLCWLLAFGNMSADNSAVTNILNNFTGNMKIVKCEEITNYWGYVMMPDGEKILPKTLWSIVISINMTDMCNRFPIDCSTVAEFITLLHGNELYYLDVDEVYEVFGDPWNIGDNYDPRGDAFAKTWNTYLIPNMRTFNGEVSLLIPDEVCIHDYSTLPTHELYL